ncbi:unnamed protein product [Prunus armeniaca]|uniref:Formin-like protein n=1 Tax=Prunus armeniaca TaxID=36596 RepID=A0A6J5V523_PRUAR|nr:unnamed protein product [Prunus armeniaca]
MKLRAPDHHLRQHHSALFFSIFLSLSLSLTPLHALQTVTAIHRRILHQPLFPDSSSPPPEIESPPIPPPPPADVSSDPTDQPFFHELPSGSTPDQPQSPPPPSNSTVPIPQASQPTKGTKRVAIAASVGIVTLGMLSALAFFLYRHRVKHPSESEKLVNGGGPGSPRFADDSRIPPSSFLYIGTVEPGRTSTTSSEAVSGPTTTELNRSPYHRLNSVKISDRYRPSPELQPLPPLSKPPQNLNSPSPVSSSDEESHETAFHSPNCSSISYDDSYYTPRQGSVNGGANCAPIHVANSIPHSKRTSPKSRLSVSSTTRNQVAPPPPPPPPPPPMPLQTQARDAQQRTPSYSHKRPKFSSPPPPPPNLARVSRAPVPPPPPPPPSRPPILRQQEVGDSETVTKVSAMSAQVSAKTQSSYASIPIGSFENGTRKTAEPVADESFEADDAGGAKPKLKPLHWDKVRATSDRATVWDQLKSSSFQLNEDMMETLFGCNSANSVPKAKEPIRRSVLPPVEQENRVLDPKKSQNIAILLRALNVARDEVIDSLLDGNPEGLGAELLETLVKMAPTKEEEIKLRDYQGDVSKLGTAERFLKAVLDIPFAFKRVEAMLYRANFNTEVKYLRKSFQTLEEASEELKNSRLFLKLLEAVLRTGNRMNVGTNRGDAKSFKLDTLLKLVDIKGTDGKTTLLHFVVQEIIRSEGSVVDSTNEDAKKMPINAKEDDFKKQGLQIVAGLGRDLSNVKNAAGMDSDVLSGYVSKLEMGLEKVKLVLQYEKPDMQGKFFNSMKIFLKEAEEEILRIKADERKALYMVKEVTEYFHGDTAKEEAHPFRIFMIVRDFLNVLDQVCKEVGRMQDRTLVGSARSFRIAATASLPVLNRYNVRQDNSSDDESLSP